MNDVIEKIMDKADAVEILADEDFCDTDFLADMDPRRVAVFAELIVRECAGLCSIAAPGRDAEDIEEAILKHFGDKE
jgi:hypothetical protein